MSVHILLADATTTPWWGTPSFTLGGAILGVTITQLFNLYTNRLHKEQERQTSEQGLRRGALVDFMGASHAYLGDPQDRERQVAYYSAFSRFNMMITGEVRDAARELTKAVTALGEAPLREPPPSGKEWNQLHSDVVDSELALIGKAQENFDQFGLPRSL